MKFTMTNNEILDTNKHFFFYKEEKELFRETELFKEINDFISDENPYDYNWGYLLDLVENLCDFMNSISEREFKKYTNHTTDFSEINSYYDEQCEDDSVSENDMIDGLTIAINELFFAIDSWIEDSENLPDYRWNFDCSDHDIDNMFERFALNYPNDVSKAIKILDELDKINDTNYFNLNLDDFLSEKEMNQELECKKASIAYIFLTEFERYNGDIDTIIKEFK